MIQTDGLTKRFEDVTAVEDVSVCIEDGEWVLLVGANGSGKTTLVRHFNALLEPDAGTVEVDGIDPTDSPVSARTRVGMVFQHPRDQFVAGTVEADVAFGPENLGLDREEIAQRVERALDAVGLNGRREALVDRLSGGEQARVAIAGALAMEPSHLVLDEPFSGLDLPARESLLSYLDTIAAETSIVVVTHDLRDLIERADRVIAMSEGRVVLEGPPDAVRDELPGLDVAVPSC